MRTPAPAPTTTAPNAGSGGAASARDVGILPEPAQERLHHRGVPLGPRPLAHAADRLVAPQRLAVGTVGRHRVEGIRDRNDLRPHAQAITREAVRVPLAVDAFLVVADDVQDGAQATQGLADPLANRGMVLHLFVLLGGERP